MVMIYNVTRLTGDIPTYEVKSARESKKIKNKIHIPQYHLHEDEQEC